MSRKKIVIIDDEEDLCQLMKAYFLDLNHDVFLANTLSSGLSLMKEVSPDVVFIDNNLPPAWACVVRAPVADIDRQRLDRGVGAARAGQRLFRQVVSTYAARHRVKPGMTGWAQVRGWRGLTDTEEKLEGRVRNDIFYVDNWSLSLDFQILLRTLVICLLGKNAY